MGLRVKLVKSKSGASGTMLQTIQGLGLVKLGDERLLKDTPAIRGMVFKVKHLVSQEVVNEEPKANPRRKPRKIVQRDRARAAAEKKA